MPGENFEYSIPVTIPNTPEQPEKLKNRSPLTPRDKVFLREVINLLQKTKAENEVYQRDKTKLVNIRNVYNQNIKLLSYLQRPANAVFVRKYAESGHIMQLQEHLVEWTTRYKADFIAQAPKPEPNGNYNVDYDSRKYKFPTGISESLNQRLKE